jgi:hypothetical protein
MLGRLISDVDSVHDLFIRGIVPSLAAALTGACAVTAALLIFAPAAGVLLAAGRHDDDGAGRVLDDLAGNRPEQQGLKAAGPPRADHYEVSVARGLDQGLSGEPAEDGDGDGSRLRLAHLAGGLGDGLLDGLAHLQQGFLSRRDSERVASPGTGHGRVDGQDSERDVPGRGLAHGPVQGTASMNRSIHPDNDSGHFSSSA